MMNIGPYELPNNIILAPMAGVTDRPFRQLCHRMGAGLVVSEMVSANLMLKDTRKTKLRLDHEGEGEPISVQIAGGDPEIMALAAKFNVDHGAQIIDINMGCPAKKVCKKAAGSALLQDESLVADILDAVVKAVDVPVTLKIRTGWDRDHKNGIAIAKLAVVVSLPRARARLPKRGKLLIGRRLTSLRPRQFSTSLALASLGPLIARG